MSRVCIIDVALNGYGGVYGDCVRSHESFARRHHYSLLRLAGRSYRVDWQDAAWSKLELIARALEHGHGWVALIDTDALLTRAAPPIETVEVDGCDIYAARGHSGRWNSGVLIVKNTDTARRTIDAICRSRDTPVPDDEFNGWRDPGENGHVISHLNQYAGVAELPTDWNNMFEFDPSSYVIHLTGPLKRNDLATRLKRTVALRRSSLRPSLTTTIPDRDKRMAWLSASAAYVDIA
jgi:hypothetical protein